MVLVLVVVLVMVGIVNNGDTLCFGGRRGSLKTMGKCVRRAVRKRGIVGMFGRRRGIGRRFTTLGNTLGRSSAGTGAFTDILVPVVNGLSGVGCTIVTVTNKLLYVNNFAAVNAVDSFLRCSESFSRPVTGLSRRFGGVLTTLTNTRHVFSIVSERPRRSGNCMGLMGTGCSRGNGLARYGRRANL